MAQNENVRQVKEFVEKNGLLLISVIFAIVVFIKILLSLNFYAPYALWDEVLYDSLTQNLLHGRLYTPLYGTLPPGYPILMTIGYLVAGDKATTYHIMLVISAIVSTSMIFPAYFLLKRYCTILNSLLGAIAVSTLPFINFFSFSLMTETLFTPLFLFSIWFMLKSYETNDKKWELLASLSVVYLYMTHSTGLAIIIAFLLTFVFYIAVNAKTCKPIHLIMNKSFLLLTFIAFLASWILFSTYFTNISQQTGTGTRSSYNLGSSYNIVDVSQHGLDVFTSIAQLVNGLKLLTYISDYLLIASCFFLLLLIFYGTILFINKKISLNDPLSIATAYWLIATMMLIGASFIFVFLMKVYLLTLGRYFEPAIPFMIILGIIGFEKINKALISKKQLYCFAIVFIILTVGAVYTLIMENSIIAQITNYVNHPTMYSFVTFYGPDYLGAIKVSSMHVFPALAMIGYFLIFLALICISIGNKRYVSLLLIFLIVSSILLSICTYNQDIFISNFRKNNDINQFLSGNTNASTMLLIDNGVGPNNIRSETCTYGFWNRGNIGYIDAENTTIVNNDSITYVISTKDLNYTIVANDQWFKLYRD